MQLARHIEGTKPRSGLWRLLAVGVVCAAVVVLSALSPVASAVPSSGGVRLGGTAKGQVDSLTAQAKALEKQVEALDIQLEASTEAYNQLCEQLDGINVQMVDLRGRLEAAQADHQYRLGVYEERICDLYKSGDGDEVLDLLLNATDVSDFFSRAKVAAEVADQDKRLLQSLKQSTATLDNLLAQVDQAKGDELIIRNQMDDQQAQINATLNARQEALNNVDAQITAIIEAERQRQAEEQQRLQQALANILNGGEVYNGRLPETGSEVLNQFLQTAAAYVGITYVWGGDRPSTGMDCSGYTQYVYKQHGIKLAHYSGYQAVSGLPVDLANIMPGDLLAFGFPVHHVGIYIGEDLFLHAAGTGSTVRVGRLSERDDLAAIRRFDLKPRTGAPAVN